MYVIKRIPDGLFVAKRGAKHSYTNALQNARVFPTREAAEADRCPGNERIVRVNDIFEELT